MPQLIDFINSAPILKYALLFVLSIIEGPIVMTLAGFFIRLGYFSIVPSFIAIVTGDLAGDILWYYIGQFGAERFIRKYGKYFSISKNVVDKMENKFREHQGKVLFLSKITMGFGFALATLMAAGMARVSLKKFAFYNVLGEIIWTGLLISIGYSLGNFFLVLNNGFNYLGTFAGIVTVALALFGFARFMRQKFWGKNNNNI